MLGAGGGGARGLRLRSPFGDADLPVRTVMAEALGPGHDLVPLACKAHDLDAAIAALRPAVDGRTAILPVLNGLSHLAALGAAFGRAAVLGGLARIRAPLDKEGVVHHLDGWRWLGFGDRDAADRPRLRDIEAGRRSEGEHVLGFLREALAAAGMETGWHDLALLHVRAQEQRRAG